MCSKEDVLPLTKRIVLFSCPCTTHFYLLQVVMDEPCAVHFVGILQTKDHVSPTAAEVYNYTGSAGMLPDFNGTINVTQAGIPFSSGNCRIIGLQFSDL